MAHICVAILSFSTVGLVNFHAVFASYPLMVMALSVPILGETVGWRRWLAAIDQYKTHEKQIADRHNGYDVIIFGKISRNTILNRKDNRCGNHQRNA